MYRKGLCGFFPVSKFALEKMAWSEVLQVLQTRGSTIEIRYSLPLTNLAAQTEFSQLEKYCSSSSKDGHGL